MLFQGGQRNALQVLCNGLVPTFFSTLYLTECGFGERPIDFVNYYKESWYTLAVLGMFYSTNLAYSYPFNVNKCRLFFIASLSCCCGDTLASELGPVLFNKSNQWAFHIILWKRVPKGTNGAISLMGTLASGLGGFIVGLVYYLSLQLVFYLEFGMRLLRRLSQLCSLDPSISI